MTLPASAQDEPSPRTDEAIVVTGRAETPPRKDVYDQALRLSRVEGRALKLYDRALARFEKPVCPGVVGLKARYGQMLVDRIRDNAARLGIKLARDGCSPNLLVAIVDDGGALLTRLQRNQPAMFRLISDSDRIALRQKGPVRVWSNVEIVKAGGAPIASNEETPSIWGQMDRRMLPTRTDIHSALVVFDEQAVNGLTLTQLADYATMRGLTHTRDADSAETMATILALFATENHTPDALTTFDVAYLQSLYYWAPNVSAQNRLLRIRRLAAKAQDRALDDPDK